MRIETYKQYKEAWDRKLKEKERELERKRELLLRKVQSCARILKKLGCRQVILFGSLATGRFGKYSDIDIAVEGLSVDAYFKALGILEETFDNVTFDLIDLKEALPSVIKRIEKEGIPL
jgi:predicted nucleotidyltransferase